MKVNFLEFFIRTPVVATVISILILLVGIFSFSQLPLQLLPKVDSPLITITTEYPGANQQTVQSFVTSKIEGAINGIPGVDYITGTSTQGESTVSVIMQVGMGSGSAAMTQIMGNVASIKDELPAGVQDPAITESSSDDTPLVILAFTSEDLSRAQVGDYLNRSIKPYLEAIPGVSEAKVLGSTYAMRIWLNPIKMAAYGIDTNEIVQALNGQNIQAAPGVIKGNNSQEILSVTSQTQDASAFENIVVKKLEGNNNIYLKDLSSVSLGAIDDNINALYNGKPATIVFVQRLPDANPLTVAKNLEAAFPKLQKILPFDLKVNIAVNTTTFIRASILEASMTLILSILIVIAVVYALLRNIRATLIPLVTIPLSLFGICICMFFLGYSINLLTLLAMVLAIGLVVDDAIVVVENIYRHLEQGQSPEEAAVLGIREIASPVISMTCTLAVVYLPIVFMQGLTSSLFKEFAVSLAGAVIFSGLFALILSPKMCAVFLRAHKNQKIQEIQEIQKIKENQKGFLYCLVQGYGKLLTGALNHKKWMLVIWGLATLGAVFFYLSTPSELAPAEDQGFLQVIATAPSSTSINYLTNQSEQLQKIYEKIKSIDANIMVNGIPAGNQLLSFVRLKDWKERKNQNLSAMALQFFIQNKVDQELPGLSVITLVPSIMPGASGSPIEFVLKGMVDYRLLYDVTNTIEQKAMGSGLFLYVSDDLNYNMPETTIDINRNAAAAAGVSVGEITSTLDEIFGNSLVQSFDWYNRSYYVIPQAAAEYRENSSQILSAYVKNESGSLIPLSSLVVLKHDVVPYGLNEFQKLNSVTISGAPAPGVTLSQALSFLQTASSSMPSSIQVDFAGASREYLSQHGQFLMIFGMAFLIIYLVLAMQFGNYKDPLLILFGSVPLAAFSALLMLKLGFATINIYTQVGLLTLVGLISKHGILIAKFANNQQALGQGVEESIIQSAKTRFRPIIMTTAAMSLGALPLLFATGASANSRFDLGLVIFTGMIIGTLMTLFVLPVLYVLTKGNKA